MNLMHKQQLPQQQFTRAATFRIARPARSNAVLRAAASEGSNIVHQFSAVDAQATQDAAAAAVNRRRMIMLGCACCSSLLLAGQQTPAKASEGAVFTYGEYTYSSSKTWLSIADRILCTCLF
jgi:hypothetical protein